MLVKTFGSAVYGVEAISITFAVVGRLTNNFYLSNLILPPFAVVGSLTNNFYPDNLFFFPVKYFTFEL